MQQQLNNLKIQDVCPIEGAYEDYILSNNYLIGMIKVEGINMDLLDNHEQERLFDNYSSFLMMLAADNDSIENISMTVKLNMKRYNMYWKRKYLDIEENRDMNPVVKENILQLIASEVAEYEKIASNSELTTKQHIIVTRVKLADRRMESLHEAEKKIETKINFIKENLGQVFENFQLHYETLTADEILSTLERFTDNKTAMYL